MPELYCENCGGKFWWYNNSRMYCRNCIAKLHLTN
jgi:hypothetical protein